MKQIVFITALGLVAALGINTGQNRARQWDRVQRAAQQGLPKTAIATLDSIARQALRDHAWAEAVRAITQRIAFQDEIEGHHAEEKIRRLQAELAGATPQMRPVMEAVLAHWYWQYFQQNNWRFMQRTQVTAAVPDSDFTTWDLPRLYAEIDRHFTLALADAPLLKRTPIASFDALLEHGDAPDAYRPTLYDFLANEALEFYGSGEQAAARPEDVFQVRTGDPVFAPAREFVAWTFASTDSTSPTLKALRLQQALLRFHITRGDTAGLLDADLGRLDFAHAHFSIDAGSSACMAALERLSTRYAGHELSARALQRWAEALVQKGDRVGARRIAQRGLQRFPESAGGRGCFMVIQGIEQKSFAVGASDLVWGVPLPTLAATYRNIERLEFRLYRADFDARLHDARQYYLVPDYTQLANLDSVLRSTPVRAWTLPLPPTADFSERNERCQPPAGIPPGVYDLVAVAGDPADPNRRVVHARTIWVGDLALVQQPGVGGGQAGFVLRSGSGEPVSDALVRTWVWTEGRGYEPGPSARTNHDGLYTLPAQQEWSSLVDVRFAGARIVSRLGPRGWVRPPEVQYEKTLYFTDRAIYRPGQPVQYKGLCIDVDRAGNRYQTIAGRSVTVVFLDPNGKEIARDEKRSNDRGSFSGSFTAPRDRVLGVMSIRSSGGPEGDTNFSVEEYKRPKFEVTLSPPGSPARLEAEVAVAGVASAYTGAPEDGARVRWRVTRQATYPAWWGWRFWWRAQPSTDAQEIDHGETTTDAGGRFAVSFTARPDPQADPNDEPTFHFVVHADVTDPAGETRSAERWVNVGYTNLSASLQADAWQTDGEPVPVSVRIASLDGEPREASGEVIVVRLRQPERARRDEGVEGRPWSGAQRTEVGSGGAATAPGATDFGPDPGTWPADREVHRTRFATDSTGRAELSVRLAAGYYRARLETRDAFGRAVTAELPIRVLAPAAEHCALRVPELFVAQAASVEPGGDFTAVWGSGYEHARAYVEVEHRGQLLQAYWTPAGRTQVLIRQHVSEEMRGGFNVRVTMVRENRLYSHAVRVDVPWSNKRLSLRWEHFVSKLAPGARETWTAVVRGPGGGAADPEIVATLYDASLDAFRTLAWPASLGVFRANDGLQSGSFGNGPTSLQWIEGNWPSPWRDATIRYRRFPANVLQSPFAAGMMVSSKAMKESGAYAPAADAVQGAMVRGLTAPSAPRAEAARDAREDKPGRGGAVAGGAPAAGQGAGPSLDQVVARRNLQETAFFYPHLLADEHGEVRIEFTLPEALTRWRFLAFASDHELRAGLLQGTAVTAKDLMVQPNPPRFLREGDVLEFTVKVTNRSATVQAGRVRLNLADANTGASQDAAIGNTTPEQAFEVPALGSETFSWRLSVPDGMGVLTYKAVAATAKLSDGEEGFLPVLPRRVLVTESLPLPIRGRQTKTFDFERLRLSAGSSTLRQQSLVVQMTSNPSWYAVMALPYLMEYPYECSEQTFNRLYANALGRFIANSNPRIQRIFEQWRGTTALDSPLEKNQDIKSLLLEETPWLRQAQSESQARRNVGVLFEPNRLDAETARALERLRQMQLPDGSWPWFPGGRGNDYLTLYITTGFGRLGHLGVNVPQDLAARSLARLDGWSDQQYREILKYGHRDDNHLSPEIALYLYGRSFFEAAHPVPAAQREALEYWLGQARRWWLALGNRQSQAHVALALQRYGDPASARAIVRSLKERSVVSEEMGMFWRDTERSWWWYRAPIESQAMMIEAFDEIARDSVAVEDCRVWLLKQKQTQDWKTTKATADAVYALLLRGRDFLGSTALVEVSLGGRRIEPEQVEAGTGFYEKHFTGREVGPALARVTVKKSDPGVAWGSVHWQYFEDMSKITPYAGTPLTLQKQLFVRVTEKSGAVLKSADGPLHVGDDLVVRIVLRTDRDLEYVHLEDYRGSGVEPAGVISGYRYQDGLAYYQETRDVASHFFIDYLPKGTYVFEYAGRIQHRGRYQSGMAQIQCMYAPEFDSHSQSLLMDVR